MRRGTLRSQNVLGFNYFFGFG